MKTFRDLLSEVSQPRGEDEKNFKDKHITVKKKHPVAGDNVFDGGTKKAPKRLADYDVGEDELVYEGSFDVPTAEGGEYDEEESHKKYKRGNRSTPLRRESKMDPVGQEDDDIDNDGNVDSSDEYLHARRRAIKKAMKKEEVESLDEVSKDLLGRYATKAHNRGDMAARMSDHGRVKDMANIANRRYSGIQKAISKLSGRARVNATESVEELDESADFQPKKIPGYTNSRPNKTGTMIHYFNDGSRVYSQHAQSSSGRKLQHFKITKDGKREVHSKASLLKSFRTPIKEYVELDEGVEIRHDRYIRSHGKKASGTGGWFFTHKSGHLNNLDDEKEVHFHNGSFSNAKKSASQWAKKHGHSTIYVMEDFDQLDEISDKMKARYLDKAVQNRLNFFYGHDGVNDDSVSRFDPKKEPKWATKSGKPKKGYYDQPHKVKAREKDNRRGEIIDKTAEKLTGNPHYSIIGPSGYIKRGNAGTWPKGKKYSTESVEPWLEEELDEAKMTDAEVLSAAKALAKNGKDDKTKAFGKGLVDFYDKEGSFTPAQVGGLQNIMKNASFQMAAESVKLNELSPNKLHAYIKKALDNKGMHDRTIGSSGYKDRDSKRKSANRLAGITSASGRLADKANASMYEEVELDEGKIDKDHPIAKEYYALKKRDLKYLKNMIQQSSRVDLSGMDVRTKDHAASILIRKKHGDKKVDRVFGFNEEVELDEGITKMSSALLKFHATKKIPHGSFSIAEIEDEHDRRKKTDPKYHGVKPSLDEVTRTAIKKTISYVGPDGKARARNVPIKKVGRDDYGQEKIRADESFISEAFKAGTVRLNDGSSVSLKSEDAKLLNQMFNDLNNRNRNTMKSTLMADKNGFNEILSFAREAL